MLAYAVRRALLAFSIVAAISFGSFVAFGLSFDPTFPLALCTSAECRAERAALVAQYHLHDPILVRYWLWLQNLVHHGFGSTVMENNVLHTHEIGPPLWHAAGITAELLAVSLVLIVVLSVLVGSISARWPGGVVDGTMRFLAYVSWAMPAFLIGVLLARWLGPKGWFYFDEPHGGVVRWVRTMTLPALTVSLGLVGVYSRYIRSSMVVSLRQPYAVVARAKGLPERRVLLRHVLRNSLIPFVSGLSLELSGVVGASLAADYVFRTGGLARFFIYSLGQSDPFALTAVLVVIGGVVAVFMFVADLAVGWLDPRARLGSGL